MSKAWVWVEDLTMGSSGAPLSDPAAVCAGATATSLPHATRAAEAMPTAGASGSVALPTTLHYCQRYAAAGHAFAKRKMPHDFFRCGGGGGAPPAMLPFDVKALVGHLKSLGSVKRGGGRSGADLKTRRQETRTAFMLCHLIPMVNAALVQYKRDVCNETGT